MDVPVGIDLGTTNSVVAWCEPGGVPVAIPNEHGSNVTPSVVAFDGGQIVVGELAKELQGTGSEETTAFFKRVMGDANYVFHAAGRDHTPVDLSSYVLAQLKRDAERHLKRPVTRAVITVPAYFRNPHREATIAAGRKAGLEVLQVINEPTAAALAYGTKTAGARRTLLVYDLGGGTFDVTLLRCGEGELTVLTSAGDHELGGRDWDACILNFAASQFRREHGVDPMDEASSGNDLWVRAELCKKQLTGRQSTRISINHAGRNANYEITRAMFEDLTRGLLEQTSTLTRRVLDEQGMRPTQVDGVLLVGGSTRMPMVSELMQRTFGKAPVPGINVDEAVALGAALVAAESVVAPAPQSSSGYRIGGAMKLVDVTNHSLGAIAISADRSRYVNSIVVPKNRPIPCVERRPFQFKTRSRGANKLEILMTQGETDRPDQVGYLGRYVVDDIPRPARGDVAIVDVEYAYDLSGTVQVSASLRETRAPLPVRVEPVPDDVPDRFLKSPAEVNAPQPVSVLLAFDVSGSMSGEPIQRAQEAGRKFLMELDLGSAAVGVMAFSDRVQTLTDASQSAVTVERGIASLSVGMTGGGNDAQPFDAAFELLQRRPARRFLIVLTDGRWSDQPHAIERARRCHAESIDVIAIGFGGADARFLAAIASGADANFFTSLHDLVDTFSTIAQVITESSGGGALTQDSAAVPGRSLLRRLLGS